MLMRRLTDRLFAWHLGLVEREILELVMRGPLGVLWTLLTAAAVEALADTPRPDEWAGVRPPSSQGR